MNPIIVTMRKVMRAVGITLLLFLPVQFAQAEDALAGFGSMNRIRSG